MSAELLAVSVINTEQVFIGTTVGTAVNMDITLAGFSVDARLFAASLPAAEDVVVTSFTGNFHIPSLFPLIPV